MWCTRCELYQLGLGHGLTKLVAQVSDTRIVIAVDSSDSGSDDLDLPERCRVVKLANSVTYDRCAWLNIYHLYSVSDPRNRRMDKTLDQLERTVIPSSTTGAPVSAAPDMNAFY